ncbi:MAG: protein kinase [Pirellulaceae bacterium]
MSLERNDSEDLLRALPLPLARLYRQAVNAKSALDRHQAAYFLWEAGLKLLGATAIVTYAQQGDHDPTVADRLTNLARPALGHWWEFVRLLVPTLADGGDDGFGRVRDLVLGRMRDDLPRAAGLDAALRETLEMGAGARSTVRISELFDRLVRYRNRELGHGAAGQRSSRHYDRVGKAMLAGVAELLTHLDVLAGRRLLYVTDVHRKSTGDWGVEQLELLGETPRRLELLTIAADESEVLPNPGHLYVAHPVAQPPGRSRASTRPPSLVSLYPLAVFDEEPSEVLLLNSRRGRQRTEYLCYSSGDVIEHQQLGSEQRELLRHILNIPVDEQNVVEWAARSQAEEGPGEGYENHTGRRIGEFELLSTLGRGGMGVVYRAWQPSLGRQVALKCLMRSGDKSEERFAGEIRALGQVKHPHLVKIYTSGADGDQWFYAMELLEGATLAAVCNSLQSSNPTVADVNFDTWHKALSTVCEETRQAEKPLSNAETQRPDSSSEKSPATQPPATDGSYVRQVVQLIRQVAEAAHALHEQGVVHRDIKPGNVVVSSDGSQAVLMDLGLAQFADEHDRKLTRTRQFVGTLRYASPEQVLAVDRLDRRTDVYSLGATLWELLTLRPMFGSDEQMPTPDLMKAIQYEEAAPIRKHHPGVPADLEAIVAKCLEKDPRRRYATAAELAEELARWERGDPVLAQPPTLRYLLNKYIHRHRGGITMAAAVFLLLIMGVIGAFVAVNNQRLHAIDESLRAEEQRAAAVAAKNEAEQQRRRAESALARVEQMLSLNRVSMALSDLQARDKEGARRHLESCDPENRQFDWHYCHRLAHLELAELKVHEGPVTALAFSPDGFQLASADENGMIVLWDATNAKETTRLTGHIAGVSSLAFSPDGKRLASVSDDSVLRLWNLEDEAALKAVTLARESQGVTSVAFSLDGSRLAGAHRSGVVQLWDAASGDNLATFHRKGEAVSAITFSPNGRLLLLLDQQEIAIWNLETQSQTGALPVDGGTRCVFHPAGRDMLIGTSSGAILYVRLEKDGRIADDPLGKLSFQPQETAVTQLEFSTWGDALVSTGADGTIAFSNLPVFEYSLSEDSLSLRGGHFRSVESNSVSRAARHRGLSLSRAEPRPLKEELIRISGHRGGIESLAVSARGLVATGGADEVVRIWKVWRTQPTHFMASNRFAGVRQITFGPSSRVYGAMGQGADRLLNCSLDTGGESEAGRIAAEQTESARRSAASSRLVSSPDGSVLVAWEPEQFALWQTTSQGAFLPAKIWSSSEDVIDLHLSDDATRLVSVHATGQTRIWDLKSKSQSPGSAPAGLPAAVTADVSPDGRQLAMARPDSPVVLIWELVTGQSRPLHESTSGAVRQVLFHPDGRRVLSLAGPPGREDEVRLTDAVTGELSVAYRRLGRQIQKVAFAPHGGRRVVAACDSTLHVWDTDTAIPVLTLRAQGSPIRDFCFSPDGQRLAVLHDDGVLVVYEWDNAGSMPLRLVNDFYDLFEEHLTAKEIASAVSDDDRFSAQEKSCLLRLTRGSPWTLQFAAGTLRRFAESEGMPVEYYQRVIRKVEQLVQRSPTDQDARITLAMAHYHAGRYAEAEAALRTSRGTQLKPQALSLLAMTRFRLGKLDEAWDAYYPLRQRREELDSEQQDWLERADKVLAFQFHDLHLDEAIVNDQRTIDLSARVQCPTPHLAKECRVQLLVNQQPWSGEPDVQVSGIDVKVRYERVPIALAGATMARLEVRLQDQGKTLGEASVSSDWNFKVARQNLPRLHFFGIGVGEYADENIRGLTSPDKDLALIQRTLDANSVPLFRRGNHWVLADEQATKERIMQAIDEIKKTLETADRGDLLVIFTSSHGTSVADLEGKSKSGTVSVFTPYDFSMERRETMVFRDDFRKIDNLPCQKLYLLDFVNSGEWARGPLGGVPRNRTESPASIVLASCRQDQECFEDPSGSCFTHILAEAFRKGPREDSGVLTIADLASYVQQQTEEYVQEKFGQDQNPVFWPEDIGQHTCLALASRKTGYRILNITTSPGDATGVSISAKCEFPTPLEAENCHVRAYLNDRRVAQSPERLSDGEMCTVRWQNVTTSGAAPAQFVVELFDEESDFVFAKSAAVLTADEASGGAPPRLHFVRVAIDDYAQSPDLDNCVNETSELLQTIEAGAAGLYSRGEHVDFVDATATREALLQGIGQVRASLSQASADDLLIVTLSCSAAKLEQTGEYMLLPHDVEAMAGNQDEDQDAALAGQAIPWSSIRKLAEVPCRVVFVIDTCHAGAAVEFERAQRNVDAADIPKQKPLILAACGESQRTTSGFFTPLLVEGLKGAADRNDNGLVDIAELTNFVATEAPGREKQVPADPVIWPLLNARHNYLPLTRPASERPKPDLR